LLRHAHTRPRQEEARVQSLLEGKAEDGARFRQAFDERLAKVESLAPHNAKLPHFGNGI
jgi:hypothetical protein